MKCRDYPHHEIVDNKFWCNAEKKPKRVSFDNAEKDECKEKSNTP